MNVVDSSAWLAYFANTRNAKVFASAIEDHARLVVPTLSLYEVFKRVAQQRDEPTALQAIAVMHQGNVVELTSTLALSAARLSLLEKLPVADSIILATAQEHKATLWTQDGDFANRAGVRFYPA